MAETPNSITIMSRKFKPSSKGDVAPDDWDVSDDEPESSRLANEAGASGASGSTGRSLGESTIVEDVWGPTPGEASGIRGVVPARKGPLDEWEAANRPAARMPILTHPRVLPTSSILPPSLRTHESGAPPPRILARPARAEPTGPAFSVAPTKTKEQREKEYEEARRRIFGEETTPRGANSAKGRGGNNVKN